MKPFEVDVTPNKLFPFSKCSWQISKNCLQWLQFSSYQLTCSLGLVDPFRNTPTCQRLRSNSRQLKRLVCCLVPLVLYQPCLKLILLKSSLKDTVPFGET